MRDAVVAVVIHEDRVLLIQRGAAMPGPGYWAPPGGELEPGESQDVAVIREVREEVGLAIRPLRKVWENLSASGTHKLHWWLAEYAGGELRLDPSEISDARWFKMEEVLRLEPTFAGDREFFRSVFPCL
jgi:8-oxo-dGTP diphosphatase